MTLYTLVKKYKISKPLFIIYFTLLVLMLYFIANMIFGQKGVIKYLSLRDEIYSQNIQKKDLANQIKQRKIKIQGMKPESLDLDLLDEEAKKNLGYSSKKEIIIYQENDK